MQFWFERVVVCTARATQQKKIVVYDLNFVPEAATLTVGWV
jgi:hypothetical protein